jgi:Winged helix DNA-binding domain
MDVARARLHNQRLSSAGFTKPEHVVSWLGAVQAQDYPGAKWALALRMRRTTDAAIGRAFAAGAILRTHVMRPTWHFVAPADIHWMLALTAPRVRAATAYYDRQLGLDAALVRRSNKAMAAALDGGAQLTRQELRTVLRKAGVAADGGQRLAHLTIHAELDGVICSGALRGKQFTYALLDERAPERRVLPRDEALAELTWRYFTSHGPAQLRDFVWWSGLTMADARAGVEMAGRHLAVEVIGGKKYWFSASARAIGRLRRSAYLLPLYDEFLIAYKDRSAALDPALWKPIAGREPFSAAIVVDGRVVGGWKRTLTERQVTVALDLPVPLKRNDAGLVAAAARRFGTFLGLDVALADVSESSRTAGR